MEEHRHGDGGGESGVSGRGLVPDDRHARGCAGAWRGTAGMPCGAAFAARARLHERGAVHGRPPDPGAEAVSVAGLCAGVLPRKPPGTLGEGVRGDPRGCVSDINSEIFFAIKDGERNIA